MILWQYLGFLLLSVYLFCGLNLGILFKMDFSSELLGQMLYFVMDWLAIKVNSSEPDHLQMMPCIIFFLIGRNMWTRSGLGFFENMKSGEVCLRFLQWKPKALTAFTWYLIHIFGKISSLLFQSVLLRIEYHCFHHTIMN